MKVFISFSGERSRLVAEALHGWIRRVLQATQPFVSGHIAKGAQWPAELAAMLQESSFGIVCLTPENLREPWILFESGALSKAVTNKAHVCPYLLGLDRPDVPPPLGHFQLTRADHDDTRRLISDMNSLLPESSRLSETDVREVFDQWWPKLEAKLNEAAALKVPAQARRDQRELLEEILDLLRAQEQRETARRVKEDAASALRAFISGLTSATALSAPAVLRAPTSDVNLEDVMRELMAAGVFDKPMSAAKQAEALQTNPLQPTADKDKPALKKK